MGAIDQWRLRRLQRLGGGDIGEDHEFLDQLVRLQPFGPAHADQSALAIEDQFALGQFEIERAALRAFELDRGVSRVEWRENACEQRRARLVGAPVDRGLRLFVRELGGRPHHHPVECVAALAPVGAENHPDREGRAVLVRTQRAEVVGDALGQHRHDAIGEIDRVAPLLSLLVERRAGADVIGDIGDCDGEDEAARICRVGVGDGMDGVVVVLGVGRVDRHQREIAPVFAVGHARGARRFGLRERGGVEDVGNVVGGERDQADRALRGDRAEPFDHPRRRQTEAALAQHFHRDQVALRGVARHAGGNENFARDAALFDRQGAPGAVIQRAVDRQRPSGRLVKDLDDPAAIGRFFRAGLGVEFHPD